MKMLGSPGQSSKTVDKTDALRFADLLSKSTHSANSDKHKMWAQEIITLLYSLYPDDPTVSFYAGSVLTSTGNYQGKNLVAKDYQSNTILDHVYTEYTKDLLTIPAMPEFQFLRSQKRVYDHLTDQYFSYSGPTSMGKSFIMRMFLNCLSSFLRYSFVPHISYSSFSSFCPCVATRLIFGRGKSLSS